MGDDVFERLRNAVLDPDVEEAARAAEEALKHGIDPLEAISKGLSEGMKVVGKQFRDSEIFLPEVMEAADAFSAAMAIFESKILESGAESQKVGTVVIGTVQNDVHNIGKNIVANLLKTAGFEVVDIGIDAPPEKFVEQAKAHNPQIIGLSALLTTTMPALDKTLDAMKQAGITAKVMIGGAPVTQGYADKIGADGYAADAASAVDVAKTLLN